MQKNLKKLIIGAALVAVLLVSACGTGEPHEPTPDIKAIKTEAVQTAMVEMIVQAALSPSETPLPPTLTPLPTATLNTDATQSAAGSSSSSGSSSGGSSGTPIPTWTPDVYKCEIVDEDPLDKPQMTGSIYDKIWTVRNVGIATWTVSDYYVKWVGRDDLSPKHIYKLPNDVAPYQTVDIIVDIYIPTNPVEFPGWSTEWAIINDNGDEMCHFYHNIPSTYPAPTLTPTP